MEHGVKEPPATEADFLAFYRQTIDDVHRYATRLTGLAVVEVARSMGRSIHATESLLARGRAELRRLLTIKEDDDV